MSEGVDHPEPDLLLHLVETGDGVEVHVRPLGQLPFGGRRALLPFGLPERPLLDPAGETDKLVRGPLAIGPEGLVRTCGDPEEAVRRAEELGARGAAPARPEFAETPLPQPLEIPQVEVQAHRFSRSLFNSSRTAASPSAISRSCSAPSSAAASSASIRSISPSLTSSVSESLS